MNKDKEKGRFRHALDMTVVSLFQVVEVNVVKLVDLVITMLSRLLDALARQLDKLSSLLSAFFAAILREAAQESQDRVLDPALIGAFHLSALRNGERKAR